MSEQATQDGDSGNRPAVGSDPETHKSVAEVEVEETFKSVIDEGRRRLSRRWSPLVATGVVGGIDVGTGVLALLLVEAETHDNHLLGGLAFAVGFLALTLARSVLFTENFLIPVSTVIARQARLRMLVRLWVVSFVANLVGGWVLMWFVVRGYSHLAKTAVTSGSYYTHLGIGLTSFALAVVGGAVITLMTWTQHSSSTEGAKMVAAVTAAFLLGAGRLNHAIVASLLMFAALITGHAPFGYLDWLGATGWAVLGNVVGGVGLVTLLRIAQTPHILRQERANPAPGVPIGDHRRADLPDTADV